LTPVTILWLRQDLRLSDHPALAAALERGGALLPVYIWEPGEQGEWAPGAASRWWLHESLSALGADLAVRGSRLLLRRGPALGTLRELVAETRAQAVYWSRCYEPEAMARDRSVENGLRNAGIDARSFNSALLAEPWELATQNGGPFQVFTPFWRALRKSIEPPAPIPAPATVTAPLGWPASLALDDLGLRPRSPWYHTLHSSWLPGEQGARRNLQQFVAEAAATYDLRRNHPATPGTSRISPHLHFGEISPRQIWQAMRAVPGSADAQYLAEIGWREFAHHLLYHFPQTPRAPLREEFSRFPWRDDQRALSAWQRGLTGVPFVDAGMRELWATGWMHNRARMVVASFLVKNLRISWQHGARWFWDTLVDADLANNTLGWQWSTGCGADAAPFFRIFNPVLQGKKFDPEGAYVRRWVRQLARLPAKYVHEPWEATEAALSAAGVTLGVDYPRPLVDLAVTRAAALAAYQSLRSGRPRGR
jgi:deoxyribodipyrimidine photo-lyase